MLGWLECIAIAHQINYAIELWFASYYTDMPDISMMAACCPKDLLKDRLSKSIYGLLTDIWRIREIREFEPQMDAENLHYITFTML
jgi:hypothetical protein